MRNDPIDKQPRTHGSYQSLATHLAYRQFLVFRTRILNRRARSSLRLMHRALRTLRSSLNHFFGCGLAALRPIRVSSAFTKNTKTTQIAQSACAHQGMCAQPKSSWSSCVQTPTRAIPGNMHNLRKLLQKTKVTSIDSRLTKSLLQSAKRFSKMRCALTFLEILFEAGCRKRNE
jgi:hypothetical protein